MSRTSKQSELVKWKIKSEHYLEWSTERNQQGLYERTEKMRDSSTRSIESQEEETF